MLYHLLYPLKDLWFGFNVFRYITFRSVVFGPVIIRWLAKWNVGQYIRKEYVGQLYDLHKHKEGTPTMGGILIVVSVIISTLLWCRLDNDLVILALGGMVWMCIIGFIDDSIKLKTKSPKGICALTKLLGQIVLALIVGLFVIKNKAIGTDLYVPFLKNAVTNLGIFYILFILLVIVGTSNAVNLTDGLDGLAIGCVVFVALTYALMSYVTGNALISEYLNVFYLPGSGELTCFCAALVGAALGFLWFNGPPANIFMGDTGALSLGSAIGIVSVLIKKEVLLLIAGGVFVAEALSVILQVVTFKLTKRRLFRMTPIHHHFQITGLSEPKITVRFWIIAAILALLSMTTLKVR
jgi:phospho-N-acetylmuramoyl-pentapeptide-transferase